MLANLSAPIRNPISMLLDLYLDKSSSNLAEIQQSISAVLATDGYIKTSMRELSVISQSTEHIVRNRLQKLIGTGFFEVEVMRSGIKIHPALNLGGQILKVALMMDRLTSEDLMAPCENALIFLTNQAKTKKTIKKRKSTMSEEGDCKGEESNLSSGNIVIKQENLPPLFTQPRIYPRDSATSKIFLSDSDVTRLLRRFTGIGDVVRLNYWIESLNRYAFSQPAKFNKYKSHVDVIETWDSMELRKGRDWCAAMDAGPGFYPTWQIDKFWKDYESRRQAQS